MKKIEDLFRAQAASPTETVELYNGAIGFRIPDYQRPYDWSKDNITRLFTDCLSGFHRLGSSANADAFTFLGTLILVKEDKQEATFSGTSVAVVDGQQRLTTLTLLACALVERLTLLAANIDDFPVKPAVKEWLSAEADDWISELSECAFGAQKLKKMKTFPFPRIVRATDQRGKSTVESEYKSALAKFLCGFAEYVNDDALDFTPPALGDGSDAKKLGENFATLRELVAKLGDSEWYDSAECDLVPMDLISRAQYRALFERLGDTIADSAGQDAAIAAVIKADAAHGLLRALLVSAYFARCVVLTRVITDDESAAFDIFDALNTTGEPLTALETLKPRVIQFEKTHAGYAGSPSEVAFGRLNTLIDEAYPATIEKQNETKALIVSYGLYLEGYKLPENLASQRNFLRTRYDKAAAKSRENSHRFIRQLADMAQFRHLYWSPKGIEKLGAYHDASRLDEVQLLASFLMATKSYLVLPILARYWQPNLKQAGDALFLDVLRAVTAFLVLRRAATGTTAGIDSDFRAVMAPAGSGANKFGLGAGVETNHAVLDIAKLREALRILLAKSKAKVTERDKWVGQAADNPLYVQAREISRFMILVAADQAVATTDKTGQWTKAGVKAAANQNGYLNFTTWRSTDYATVEHVAPDTEKSGDWDAGIYKNAIIRQSLGNLCLLPAKENGAIGNGKWTRKRLFYRALTEPLVAEQKIRIEEAAAQGMKFSGATQKLLEAGRWLPLLSPLREVEEWTPEIIAGRGRNIAELSWEHLWPWLN
jgi:hypothetical protein